MKVSRRDVVVHGIVAGTIAYAVVAILFGLVDFLYGRPVYASAAFLGARITELISSGTQFGPESAIACSSVHFVIVLGAGLMGSVFVHVRPRAAFLPMAAFAAAVMAALIASFTFAAGLLGAVYLDLIWVNLAAAAAAISYLLTGPNPTRIAVPDRA